MSPSSTPSVESASTLQEPHVPEVWRILVDVLRVLAIAAGVYLLATWFHPWPQLARWLKIPNPWALADVALVLLVAMAYYLVMASLRSAELGRTMQRVQKAEADLATERTRLYRVLDNLPALVFVLNPDYTFGFVNREFRRALGEPGRQPCYEWLHGKDGACEGCLEWTPDDDGAHGNVVLWEIRGHKYAVTGQSISVGQAIQRLHVAVDLTERQAREEALRRAEQHLRLAQQVAQMGSWTWNVRTNRVHFSRALGELLGLDLGDESYPVEHLAYLVHPDEKGRLLDAIKGAQSGILPELEGDLRVVLADGKEHTLHTRQMVIQDEAGQISEIIGTTQDITAQVTLAESLRCSRDLLETSQQMGQMGGWEYIVATGDIVVTDAMRQIHDDKVSPLSLMRGFAFYVEEDRQKVEHAFWRAVHQGVPYDMEARIVTGNGRHRWMRTIGKPVIEDGQVQRVQGVRIDITERKEAEQQREALIAELKEALARVRRLSGLLPICSVCKRIRTDEGYWEDVAAYISEHAEVQFSHGICPSCLIKLSPDVGLQTLLDEPLEPEA